MPRHRGGAARSPPTARHRRCRPTRPPRTRADRPAHRRGPAAPRRSRWPIHRRHDASGHHRAGWPAKAPRRRESRRRCSSAASAPRLRAGRAKAAKSDRVFAPRDRLTVDRGPTGDRTRGGGGGGGGGGQSGAETAALVYIGTAERDGADEPFVGGGWRCTGRRRWTADSDTILE
ncbi:hypothetical protein MHPYR_150020 [uncultured Mycobacterium sp.]|uniref:Uncharacterized protein n=1 Tax=uncultured Mycobacterium sp. TaxID=171292 RepID=A0A1Y5P2C2_9MYCO|nr:hypothetical protein MHPYR_150020 [uncultured Mycobacterium sp.]